MKLLTAIITLLVSLSAFSHTHKISLSSSTALRRPPQTNLIRLYMRLPSEMRMIATNREIRAKQLSKNVSWIDGLRDRLKTSDGKIKNFL